MFLSEIIMRNDMMILQLWFIFKQFFINQKSFIPSHRWSFCTYPSLHWHSNPPSLLIHFFKWLSVPQIVEFTHSSISGSKVGVEFYPIASEFDFRNVFRLVYKWLVSLAGSSFKKSWVQICTFFDIWKLYQNLNFDSILPVLFILLQK